MHYHWRNNRMYAWHALEHLAHSIKVRTVWHKSGIFLIQNLS